MLGTGALPKGMLAAIAAGLTAIGVFFGMGGPLWPDVLESFDVSKTQFGLLSGLSLALSFPVLLFGGRLTDAWGKATVLVGSLAILGVASFGLAFGPAGLLPFAVIMAVRGLGISLVDLSANTMTIDAEKITGTHLMGPLHGTFSAGSILGAGAVAIALTVGLGFDAVYALLGGMLLVLTAALFRVRSLDKGRRPNHEFPIQRFRDAFASPTIRVCGLLTALAFAGEIIVADWTSIYLREGRGYSAVFGAACIVAFGIAMLAGRLANGPLIRLLGIRRSIIVQGLVSLVGGTLIVIEGVQAFALIGCFFAGLGLAGIGPTALSVAGISLPGDPASAAGVTLAGGYVGLAGAPVVSGLIADGVSPRATLAVVVVLGIAVVVASFGIQVNQSYGSSN